MAWDPRLGGHDREEADLREQEFRNAVGHEHQVDEALQARRARGFGPRWRSDEGIFGAQEVRDAIGHEQLVDEARQARQASGYKVRWRIAWGQVLGLLILAAVVAGFLLLLFAGSGH